MGRHVVQVLGEPDPHGAQGLSVALAARPVAGADDQAVPAAGAAEDDSSGSDSGVSVVRYGGADRYVTSLQVAEAFAADAGGSLEWVVLVSGRRWTDAVVAAPAAGALGAPVLMTPPGELRADALEFLQRVRVSKALVVGPDASGGAHGPGRGVGAKVLEALEEAGISAERVAGNDRYGTAVAAAGRVTPGVMGERGRTAVIASGDVFADALVAGPFAARGTHPVLLSPPGELHADVAAYLGEAGIDHVVLMGGTKALSGTVEQAVKDLGIRVSRVAGSTRYDTASEVAELAENQYSAAAGEPCFANDTIGIARARVPFDSFSAAPLLGRLCAPLLLADPDKIPADTVAYLDAARDEHDTVRLHIFGGEAAVSQAAVDAYRTGHMPDTGDDDEADTSQAEEGGSGGPVETTAVTPVVLTAGSCGGVIDDEPEQLGYSTDTEDPAWSPDCSRLVYTRRGSLWTVANDGTGARLLLDGGAAYLHQAAWSPDGTRIAYVRSSDNSDDQTGNIWTVDADGTDNTQLTRGDAGATWPTWSPDGKHIAFEREVSTGNGRDRHIAVMPSLGGTPTALNAGGQPEHSPAWSPDGTRLAYVSNHALVVSDVNGAHARRVHTGARGDGGLSWSPDGRRIAFVRGANAPTSLYVVDVDGSREEVVFDAARLVWGPRWSADGQRIAFTAVDNQNERRAWVAGAAGGLLPDRCRPGGLSYVSAGVPLPPVTAGFPLPPSAARSTGTLRVGVLFMDFPDKQATHSTAEEAALGLPWAEEYLEAASYGELDVDFRARHGWLRAEQDSSAYFGPTAFGGALTYRASEYAVALADDGVNFSTLDLVMVVFPSSHFSGGNALGHAHVDGVNITTTRINTFALPESREPADWGYVAAHEIAHNLGLLDMYPYDGERHKLPELEEGSVWAFVDMGLMGLKARFKTDPKHDRWLVTWHWPNGGTSMGSFGTRSLAREMLGWSRWQLDWLNPSQVHCDGGDGATVQLASIAQPQNGVALAVVPLDSGEVIVVESRRKIGYDAGIAYVHPDSGAKTRRGSLLTEGVLVYTVDASLGSGELPIKVAGDSGDSQVDDFPVLESGESVTLRGYTITVTADDGDTHTVSITRND